MKIKCPICNVQKGRRRCKRHEVMEICPQCCAESRDSNCAGCSYYEKAVQYQSSKIPKKKHFIVEINEEIEKAVDKALALVEKGEISEAEERLEALWKKHPSNHMVIYGMGVVHAFRGDNDTAIDYFHRATKVFPYFIEAHFNKAIAYEKKIDIRNAVNSFNEVIELGDPQDDIVIKAKDSVAKIEAIIMKSYHIGLGRFFEAQDEFETGFSLMENGKWEKAIIRFNKASVLNPSHPQSYGNMGLCYAQMGRKQDAIDAFDRAIMIDPNYEPAIVNRAFSERLKEGEPLTAERFKSIDYYKDYRKKSFIQEIADAMKHSRQEDIGE
jgi:tetratricopeptide (TPR) repeat protein